MENLSLGPLRTAHELKWQKIKVGSKGKSNPLVRCWVASYS